MRSPIAVSRSPVRQHLSAAMTAMTVMALVAGGLASYAVIDDLAPRLIDLDIRAKLAAIKAPPAAR